MGQPGPKRSGWRLCGISGLDLGYRLSQRQIAQDVAVAACRRTPAEQILPRQFAACPVHEVRRVVQPADIGRQYHGAIAIRPDRERVAPDRGSADIDRPRRMAPVLVNIEYLRDRRIFQEREGLARRDGLHRIQDH